VFSVTPEEPETGEQASFDATNSIGDPTGWAWDFGDGETGFGETVTHTYDDPGVYSVALTISKVVPGSGCGSFGQELCTHTTTADVTVGEGGGSGGCVANDTTLCLLDGRFEVTARWHNQRNGEQGTARVYQGFSGDRTGMFWFFRPDNVELIAKSLDATDPDLFPDPAFWFFYGGLSDVEYWITVRDTARPEELPKEYHNEPGVICGFADTDAFEPDVTAPVIAGLTRPGGAAIPGDDGGFDVESIAAAGTSGTCTPTGDNLCLLDGRFSIEVEWHDQHNGNDGVGHPILGTDRTGYFWFFNSDNIELVTKMIDGGVVNGHFWVLWGALSDVEYTIRVTDTATSAVREYHNPPGSFCGGAAANAFPSP
ncbi:MAG: PKD domain-containing protein, partial [Chloroflexi bacterium]|nr:PKD domain-containing protein [Chloroflexota bacterium]